MYLPVTSAGMFFTLWEKNSIKLLTTHIVYIRLYRRMCRQFSYLPSESLPQNEDTEFSFRTLDDMDSLSPTAKLRGLLVKEKQETLEPNPKTSPGIYIRLLNDTSISILFKLRFTILHNFGSLTRYSSWHTDLHVFGISGKASSFMFRQLKD